MTTPRYFLNEYGFFIFFGTIMFLLVCWFLLKFCDKTKKNKYYELQEDKPPEYNTIVTPVNNS
jgi:hypothetical protein